MKEKKVKTQEVLDLGYNVVATAYEMNEYKVTIQPNTDGKIVMWYEGRVICTFHLEKSETGEGKAVSYFTANPYKGPGIEE